MKFGVFGPVFIRVGVGLPVLWFAAWRRWAPPSALLDLLPHCILHFFVTGRLSCSPPGLSGKRRTESVAVLSSGKQRVPTDFCWSECTMLNVYIICCGPRRTVWFQICSRNSCVWQACPKHLFTCTFYRITIKPFLATHSLHHYYKKAAF